MIVENGVIQTRQHLCTIIHDVHVGFIACHQQLHRVQVSRAARQVERRRAAVVLHVDQRIMLQQNVHTVHVTAECRNVKGR